MLREFACAVCDVPDCGLIEVRRGEVRKESFGTHPSGRVLVLCVANERPMSDNKVNCQNELYESFLCLSFLQTAL